jgi:septal ring factor EnvC (AmiA/AmiB activator)
MSAGKWSLSIIFFFFALAAYPQKASPKSKAQLQREKQQNLEKIKETEKILSETSQQKESSLGELSALNQRIVQQEELISSIKGEIRLLDNDISEDNDVIDALQQDLVELRKEYAVMVQAAQKANGKADQLMFLFSATSFDQFLLRLNYMEQYGRKRKEQGDAIVKVQNILEDQVKQTENIRKAKSTLLNDEEKENRSLANMKSKQRTLVRSLQKEEKRLKEDIEETRKATALLDKMIEDIVREELARAEREREARAKANATSRVAETNTALSASFEDNKKKFTWPASGFISQKFGRQNHPALKGIVINNNGINIQTRQDEKVKCIFNGEVRQVVIVGVLGNSIIINHGDYYSVYAGLKQVYVKRGDKVTANQEIGQVLMNSSGVSELKFMIYKKGTPVDPESWLRTQ